LRPNLERKWAPLLPFPSQHLENLGCANDSIMYLSMENIALRIIVTFQYEITI